MRTAMTTLCPVFNTNRMVHAYVVDGYLRADERRARLEEDDFRRARELARWKERVRKGTLAAADVVPQVYLGKLHEGRDIVEPEIVPMENQRATAGATCSSAP